MLLRIYFGIGNKRLIAGRPPTMSAAIDPTFAGSDWPGGRLVRNVRININIGFAVGSYFHIGIGFNRFDFAIKLQIGRLSGVTSDHSQGECGDYDADGTKPVRSVRNDMAHVRLLPEVRLSADTLK